MRHKILWIYYMLLVLACTPAAGTCGTRSAKSLPPQKAPRVFSLPATTLQRLRGEITNGKLKDPALDELRADADKELAQEPLSVTSKPMDPPSGDKHDYLSLAPYWWPDPAKPKGLPYIRRDGEVNPEIQQVQDHKNFDRLMSSVHTLALAYYFFGDESYAAHATQLLRVWFLDPKTRMNANLEFAQGIPGINTGRGTGLIETRDLYRVVDAVGLLDGSRSWTAEDQKGMEDWCSRFLDWIMHSKNGKDEAAAKNNHGSYYDVQVASLALFIGKVEEAKRVLEAVPRKRIEIQIEPDGRQPLELARTKSLGYSAMNLSGLFELGLLGENVGVNLWNFRSGDGRSIRNALDYLIPFVSGRQKWPFPQIIEFKSSEISPLLVAAAVKYGEPQFQDLAMKIDPDVVQRIDLLPFRRQSSQ
jgi:alginate lyase